MLKRRDVVPLCDSIHEWPAGSFLMCDLVEGHRGPCCARWVQNGVRKQKTWVDESRRTGEGE